MTYSEIEDLINENLASGIRIPAVDHREVEMALLNYINDNLPKQFDIKWIYVDSVYLGNNFEVNGLGKNLRLGWALVNGNNGTPPNSAGKMFMNYGGDFTTLNEVAGEKEHILSESEMPSHYHSMTFSGEDATSRGSSRTWLQQSSGSISKNSEPKGGGLAHNNMPPYITLVAIMKL